MTEEEKKLLKPLLWDTNIETVDLKFHRRTITSRIMVFGKEEHLRWMHKKYSEEEIIEAVKKSKTLSEKAVKFWSNYYKLDKSEVYCLNKKYINGYF